MKKKFVTDISLNTIAAAVPIAVLQLVIYPVVARRLGGESYGLMLTIHSIWVVISNSLGNILNNTRLLLNEQYRQKNIEGDFIFFYRCLHVFNAVAVCVFTGVYCGNFSFYHIFLSVVVAYFILAKAYLEVGFRIKLNYKDIAFNNAILSLGLLVGFIIFYISGIWEFVFLIGYGSSYFFCKFKTKLTKESKQKTELHKKVRTHIISLGFATIISSAVVYADKLLLYPLMGGHMVSVYFAASLAGKVLAMLTGPVTSVVLSYVSKWDKTKMSTANKIIVLGALCTFVGYFIALFVGRPVIGLLYPQWIGEVAKILPVTTMTVMLSLFISIINPFVLKFCNIRWQTIITAVQVIVYFPSALILWHFYGLMGFCIGTAIGKLANLGMLIFVYFLQSKKNQVKVTND